MVCIYCGSDTRVTNSRAQKRANHVWRRRQCTDCEAIFTSTEETDLSKSVVVVSPSGAFSAFQRDKLMLSVYDALRHRKTAQTDASALTDTIISKVLTASDAGSVTQGMITDITARTLKAFDNAAATHYAAFHPSS